MNFYSVSGDGSVVRWTVVKGALLPTDAIDIPFTKQLENFKYHAKIDNLKGMNFKLETNCNI